MRARKPAVSGYSLLLCAGLAFIFVTPDEGRDRGSPSAPALEVAPAQARVPTFVRHVALPTDRVMTASADALGGGQAPDVWSTPLAVQAIGTVDETGSVQDEDGIEDSAGAPAAPVVAEAPAVAATALGAAAGSGEPPIPSMLFEHASLVDQPVAIENPSPSARAASPSSLPPLTLRSLAGKWAPHPSACADRGKKSAFLPLTLDERGARAGDTTCSFRKTDQAGSRWTLAATCTDAAESWNANIRLALAGRKLTWSSERGSQTYSRCP